MKFMDMSLSMSMSMDTTPQPFPTKAPSTPTLSLVPTAPPSKEATSPAQPSPAPSLSSRPTLSVQPSSAPSVSFQPTISAHPSSVPSVSLQPTVSKQPSTSTRTNEPTPLVLREQVVFTCTNNGIALVEPPYEVFSVINFKVGYIVESDAVLDVFLSELEAKILETAVTGALQCNSGGPLFEPGGDALSVPMSTTLTGEACTPKITNCTVMETEFQIVVNEDLDPEVAAFLGYVLLQEEMDGGIFVIEIPILDRVEYVSPLPLLPPVTTPEDDDVTDPALGASDGSVSVSPWTIGAVLAMCKFNFSFINYCLIIS